MADPFPTPPRPHAFIQWKGTKACMDVYCRCGEQFHIDDYAPYYVRCHHCGQTYQTGWYVEMRPVEVPEGEVKMDPNAEVDRWLKDG